MRRAIRVAAARFYEVEFKFGHVDAGWDVGKYGGASFDEARELRDTYLSPSMATFQAFDDRPFYNTRGRMQYIFDEEGRQYLDMLAQNQTISVGHNHPRVMQAAFDQMEDLCHSTTMYYNDAPGRAAEALVDRLPGDDWVVHFLNSGAEAIDLALLLARTYTGNYDILAVRNCYHGLVTSCMDLTALSKCKQHYPHGFGVKHVMKPDTYRGIWKADDPDAGYKYAEDVKDTIFYETSGKIAAFLYEPIQGYGGVTVPPPGYIEAAEEYVHAAGGVVIADEIQTGFGRTGCDYWGFEMHNSNPDIVTFAKGLGNGFPVSAVAVKKEIAEPMTEKSYFNTYGGNPTMTTVGLTVMEVIDEDDCMENARIVGDDLIRGFGNLKEKYPIVGDYRGIGLMQGVEIVDPITQEPHMQMTIEAFELMRDNGIIPGRGGTHGNVFRINPPLCMSLEDSKHTEDVFGYVFETIQKKFGF